MRRLLLVLFLVAAGVLCGATFTILVPMLASNQPFYPTLKLAFGSVVYAFFLLGGLVFVYAGVLGPNETILKFSRLGWLISPESEIPLLRTALVVFGLAMSGLAYLGLKASW